MADCASGTLFALGGGNSRLIGTLFGFVVGSALGAAHMGFWWSLPALPAATAQGLVGYGPAAALQLLALGVLFLVARRFSPASKTASRGVSTLMWGGIALAVLNAAVLLLSGKPWGETSAFALWGSKWAVAAGIDARQWAYWLRPGFNTQLDRTVLLDATSVMDGAILLGAALAAAWAAVFRPSMGRWRPGLGGGVAGRDRDGLRRTAVERVQHRRLFLGDRGGQSLGLGLDGAGAGWKLDRDPDAAAVPAGRTGERVLTRVGQGPWPPPHSLYFSVAPDISGGVCWCCTTFQVPCSIMRYTVVQ